MVKYGMTPLQALQAGLLNGAKLLGWQGQIGALKTGYFADVIAVPCDPLKDIGALEKSDVCNEGRGSISAVATKVTRLVTSTPRTLMFQKP